jgi:hypothetical protein
MIDVGHITFTPKQETNPGTENHSHFVGFSGSRE